jgi:hypothetical protein
MLAPFSTLSASRKGGSVTHFAPRLLRRIAMPLCMLLAALTRAVARTVTVDCEKTTVSNALKTLDPQASNTIKLTGTCRDSIGINDFADICCIDFCTAARSAS